MMPKKVEYENLKKVNASFFAEFEKKFKEISASGWYILGKEVAQFEERFAAFIGMKHCIGVASGLDALILSLMALDLEPKSEVIVSSNAYIACILSIIKAGLVPILVDPSSPFSHMDVNKIAEKISSKTKVIMPVHLYGYPCDMEAICALAKRHHLLIVEDCAQAHGAQYFGKNVGTFSSISAFSFYPTKNLGALGDAGAVLTEDDNLALKLRALRNYGQHTKNQNDYQGLNSRLDEIQAGFLNVKLPHLNSINQHKRKLAALYDKHLDPAFVKPSHALRYYGVYHIYNVYHPERDKLRAFLNAHGITTEIHYPIPPYRQKALQGMFNPLDFKFSDYLHASTLSLPISYFHQEEDILYVCEIMNKYKEEEEIDPNQMDGIVL